MNVGVRVSRVLALNSFRFSFLNESFPVVRGLGGLGWGGVGVVVEQLRSAQVHI